MRNAESTETDESGSSRPELRDGRRTARPDDRTEEESGRTGQVGIQLKKFVYYIKKEFSEKNVPEMCERIFTAEDSFFLCTGVTIQ